VTLLRDIGAAMSPFNAFMFIGARDRGAADAPALREQRCGGRLSDEALSRMGELILHAPMCPMADSSVRVIIASKSISRMSGHGMLATQPAQVSDFIQTRFGHRS
jgi:hypothetical protein